MLTCACSAEPGCDRRRRGGSPRSGLQGGARECAPGAHPRLLGSSGTCRRGPRRGTGPDRRRARSSRRRTRRARGRRAAASRAGRSRPAASRPGRNVATGRHVAEVGRPAAVVDALPVAEDAEVRHGGGSPGDPRPTRPKQRSGESIEQAARHVPPDGAGVARRAFAARSASPRRRERCDERDERDQPPPGARRPRAPRGTRGSAGGAADARPEAGGLHQLLLEGADEAPRPYVVERAIPSRRRARSSTTPRRSARASNRADPVQPRLVAASGSNRCARRARRRTSPRTARPPAPGRPCGRRGTRAACRRGGDRRRRTRRGRVECSRGSPVVHADASPPVRSP